MRNMRFLFIVAWDGEVNNLSDVRQVDQTDKTVMRIHKRYQKTAGCLTQPRNALNFTRIAMSECK